MKLFRPYTAAKVGIMIERPNISTTQRYMHLDEKELADAQDLID